MVLHDLQHLPKVVGFLEPRGAVAVRGGGEYAGGLVGAPDQRLDAIDHAVEVGEAVDDGLLGALLLGEPLGEG
ncbi:hypothetical protein [Methylobacterium gregans]|uniref:hypothetical protein n=1 Tax=Methylobacterium gregans TaxID=374424 RepID=UPI003613CFFA